jgi:hypothetical protein
MNSTVPLLVVDRPCAETLNWLQNCLSRVGLRAVQTFDLREARAATAGCSCPHHGTAVCDCQMIVLLVYREAEAPASLVLHSNDGRTWISLVGTPAQPVNADVGATLQEALSGGPNEAGL